MGSAFTLVSFGSFVGAGYGFDFTNAPLPAGESWNTGNFATTGTISVVPEPRALVLFGLGVMGWTARRRRRMNNGQ